ncbi:MAG: heavy-metal-associated domain-containing protein [candidate division NC10 bacterium]|nr:heavy-metal-associated domain-containing protein [candidate division NC10 bacterium]MBI4840804.1 heavy-metal-associated domain-containing protein [candidate division NC10 bacterium]
MSRLPGVGHIEVSLERAEAIVRYDPDRITPADIVATINRLGFQARLLSGGP